MGGFGGRPRWLALGSSWLAARFQLAACSLQGHSCQEERRAGSLARATRGAADKRATRRAADKRATRRATDKRATRRAAHKRATRRVASKRATRRVAGKDDTQGGQHGNDLPTCAAVAAR
eukprot:142092-Chlamydomonas_euryale.AAC.4